MEFLLVAVVIGLIPAAIAHGKGQNFFLWWLYGAAIWIVAIIHAIVLKGPEQKQRDAAIIRGGSEAQELERFAKLKADGHISAAEFEAKKRQLLGL